MSFPKQIPKRRNAVVIELGKDKIIKHGSTPTKSTHDFTTPEKDKMSRSMRKTDLKESELNTSVPKSIHQIDKSNKPDLKSQLSKQRMGNYQQKQVAAQIQDMIKDLLETKQVSKFVQQPSKKQKSTNRKPENSQKKNNTNLQTVKRLVNKLSKPITTTLPFANLDVLFPEWWDYYEGQTAGDLKHGYGTLFLTNGEKFTGRFQNDKAEGNGTFYNKNGKIVIGVWRQNELIKRII